MQEKTLTGGRSYYLDIARAIAIISISLNHAVNRTYDNYFGQMEEFLESSYLSSLLKSVATVFSHLGVPLFLMISGALLPALNSLLVLRDIPPMDTAVHLFNLCSIYYLYVFAGYFISQGGLQRLRTGEVAVLTVLLFALICGYQLYAYSDWVDYLVDYDFPLLLLCAMGLLELLRRGAEHLRGLRPVVTYLAKISFGVYFIHILIMSLLEWNMNFDGWARSLKLLFLEGVSVGGSILLIALFSGIPFCRRRMFGIKG